VPNILYHTDFVLLQADLLKKLAFAQTIYLGDAVVHQLKLPKVHEKLQGGIQARDLSMVED
jgi:hypothetical protein